MNKHERCSLRTRLRNETLSAHEALDRLMSQFDLGERHGLSRFLSVQKLALASLRPHGDVTISGGMIRDLLVRADRDLEGLNATTPGPGPDLAPAPHPLAIDYVMTGSRLGDAVLRKRWLATKDVAVRQAGSYFSAPTYIDNWRAFCAQAEQIDPTGALADQVIADAVNVFGLYVGCIEVVDSVGAAEHG